MKQLVCPKCLHDETVTDNTRAWCEHGKPPGRFNPPIEMIPIEQLATEKADA